MRHLLVLILAVPLLAQNPPAPNPAKPKGPPPEPKNLQVLKLTRAELIPLMRSYNQALGVQCTFCHVQGDFASDENPHKKTARMMITLTAKANAEFSEGKGRVGCWTCHRGEQEPAATPALPPPAPPKPPAQ